MQRRRSNLPKKGNRSDKISRQQLMPNSASGSYENIDELLPIPSLRFASSSILIVFCSLICYWGSVHGDFVFDDSEAIVNNKDVTSNTALSEVFTHDFWGSDITSNLSHKSYRPFTTLTFKLNYYMAGGLHPWGFHFLNLIAHTIVCILFLSVFDILFGTFDGCYSGVSAKLKFPRASLLSTLLFTVHPVHTESVCGIVGRAELLSAFMFALSFLFYAQSCKEGERKTLNMFIVLAMSMMSAAVAMLFKEQGITVLGICSVYDVVLACGIGSPFFKKPKEIQIRKDPKVKIQASPELPNFKPFIYRQLILVSCGILMVFGRFLVMGKAAPKFKPVDNPASFLESTIFRVINYNYIYSINVWLLIFPWWLCFDWSMGCVPVINSISDFRIIVPVFMWVVFLCISWCFLRSPRRSIFLMALALLIVPFLPASNLFFQVGFVVAERVLYLSTAGYCVLFVLTLAYISKCLNKKISAILTYGCLTLFIWRSLYRSYEWVSEESLFTSGAEVCPLNAKVHYNIGKIRADVNNVAEALKHYNEAIRLHPEYDQAYNNLGNLLQSIGDSSGAEKALENALAIRPTFAAAWMNLGIAKSSLKKYQESEKCYLNALKHRRKYPDAHYNLGNLYIEWKKPQKALQQFQKSIELDPLKENAWNNFILLLENTDQVEKAVLASKEALKLLPRSPSLHFSLGNILGKTGKYEESESHFLQAIHMNNANADYYGNLGVLYHRWGKLAKAEKYYSEALKMNPGSQTVKENLKRLRKKTRKE